MPKNLFASVEGEGYPQCEWDFAAGHGQLKITANCPGAYVVIEGKGLRTLERMLALAIKTEADAA